MGGEVVVLCLGVFGLGVAVGGEGDSDGDCDFGQSVAGKCMPETTTATGRCVFELV